MAISKRLRFEILRRDNHACRYCGATAPDTKLTIDHVIPAALGGSDEPTNLVTACADCNGGKTSITPDAPHVQDASQAAIKWSAALKKAAEKMDQQLKADQSTLEHFENHIWGAWTYGTKHEPFPLPISWRNSIRSFLAAGLTMQLIEECVDIACERDRMHPDARFKYMCGIAWRHVRELQDAALSIMSAEEAE